MTSAEFAAGLVAATTRGEQIVAIGEGDTLVIAYGKETPLPGRRLGFNLSEMQDRIADLEAENEELHRLVRAAIESLHDVSAELRVLRRPVVEQE